MIHLITGGERSGKSRYAQQLAEARSDRLVYLATAPHHPEDDAWTQRIDHHRQVRDHRWTTVEEPLYLSRALPPAGIVVIDCVTLWLSNWFSNKQYQRDATLRAARAEVDRIEHQRSTLLFVTNEVGMGLHADTQIGRDFVELQGWINQYIAQQAERVTFMVAGLPMTVK